MVYLCTKCKFLFESGEPPKRCPDCGMMEIIPAGPEEQEEYRRNRCLYDEMEQAGG